MSKIIIAGQYKASFYEEALLNAFKSKGWNVKKFSWSSNRLVGNSFFTRILFKLYYKVTDKYLFGPEISRINNSLIKQVIIFSPKVLFINRGTHIIPSTIKKVNSLGVITIGYNNDDSFGDSMNAAYWRHFNKSIYHHRWNFVYRPKNLVDYYKIGLHNTSVLKPYYISSRNFKIHEAKKIFDLVFIGHFEDDGRDDFLVTLIEKSYKVAVFGDRFSWSKSKHIKRLESKFSIKQAVENYNLVINQSWIALNFLSKKNNDVYTRRCFEIPASGTLLMSEYTDALSELLIPDVEAVYFYNVKNAIDLFEDLIMDKDRIKNISQVGHRKILLSKHDVQDRVQEIIDQVGRI